MGAGGRTESCQGCSDLGSLCGLISIMVPAVSGCTRGKGEEKGETKGAWPGRCRRCATAGENQLAKQLFWAEEALLVGTPPLCPVLPPQFHGWGASNKREGLSEIDAKPQAS